MADEEADARIRKANRAHKLRRRRKVAENPMSGGSLRSVYPAVLRRRLAESQTKEGVGDHTRQPR
jgi:hypothetical protein